VTVEPWLPFGFDDVDGVFGCHVIPDLLDDGLERISEEVQTSRIEHLVKMVR